MPKQVNFWTVRPFDITPWTWRALSFTNWQPKNMSGNTSAVLPAAGGMFISTVTVQADEALPEAGNLLFRVQTLDRQGAQRHLFPMAEVRGTSNTTWATHTQIGNYGRDTNLRLLVTATHRCRIQSADWRVLYWP